MDSVSLSLSSNPVVVNEESEKLCEDDTWFRLDSPFYRFNSLSPAPPATGTSPTIEVEDTSLQSKDSCSQSRGGNTPEGFSHHPFTNFDHQINIGSEGVPDLLDKRFNNGEHTRPGSNLSQKEGSQSRGGTTTEGFNNHPFTNSDSHMIESGGVFNGEHTHPACDLSLKGAAGTSSSPGGRDTSLQLRDSRVKLRIKSFVVPEFFIEIPENLTVGSLKRKVMEELTAIVGDKVQLDTLEAKMVGDNNETVMHNGISHDRFLEVTVETRSSRAPPHLCPDGSAPMLPCNLNQPPTRYSPVLPVVNQGNSNVSSDLLANVGNLIRVCQDLVESHTDMSIEESTPASYGATSLPASSRPPIRGSTSGNSNQSKNMNRRSPRPFSPSEVEALVQAVEEHGTGRWQEIQERTFKHVSNRTYTDLKDKWRNLVKTAKQPANKRRGVVLSQELLDRVRVIEAHNSPQLAIQ